MTTLPSGNASHKAWLIVPFKEKIIFVTPLSIVYHIVSKLRSEISTLKFGAASPNTSNVVGELIIMLGATISTIGK